jgi:hypothetical protein
MGVSTVIAFAGIGGAWLFYGGGYRAPAHKLAAAVPGFVALVRDKFRVDELYALVIVRPLKLLSRGLFLAVDRVLIDKVLVGGVALVVDVAGRISRTFQVGDVQRYLAVFAVGLLALFYVAIKPSAPGGLDVRVTGQTVEVDAGKGAPAGRTLLYEFDFDDDGHTDKSGSTSNARFSYEGRGRYTIKVTIRDPRWDSVTTVKKRVSIK